MNIKSLDELKTRILLLNNQLEKVEAEVSDVAGKTKEEDLLEFYNKLLSFHNTLDEFEDEINGVAIESEK